MTSLRKLAASSVIAVAAGMAALAVSAPAANAYTVCNNSGDCWHESTRYHYPRAVGVRFYNDDWRGRHHWDGNDWRWRNRDWHWRDHHDGRGYWRNGIW